MSAYQSMQQKFNAKARERKVILDMPASARHNGAHGRDRSRIKTHERLQAQCKRARDTNTVGWRATFALKAFIKQSIPLAGCLTPRALKANGQWALHTTKRA